MNLQPLATISLSGPDLFCSAATCTVNCFVAHGNQRGDLHCRMTLVCFRSKIQMLCYKVYGIERKTIWLLLGWPLLFKKGITAWWVHSTCLFPGQSSFHQKDGVNNILLKPRQRSFSIALWNVLYLKDNFRLTLRYTPQMKHGCITLNYWHWTFDKSTWYCSCVITSKLNIWLACLMKNTTLNMKHTSYR